MTLYIKQPASCQIATTLTNRTSALVRGASTPAVLIGIEMRLPGRRSNLERQADGVECTSAVGVGIAMVGA